MSYDVLTPAAARLWSYSPEWGGGFRVTRSFDTDIFTSRSGREQRRALRDTPRMALEYQTVQSGRALQDAVQFLRANQNRPTVVPDFTLSALLSEAALVGADTIQIDTPPVWCAEGQTIVFCVAGADEKAVILSVDGDTITLTLPLATAKPLGAVVRPGHLGLLGSQIRANQFKPSAAEIGTLLVVYPGGEIPESEGAAGALFNGLEVFEGDADFKARPSFERIWRVEQVDFGRGRTAQFRPVVIPQEVELVTFTGVSASRAAAIEQFFLRQKGRRGVFYRSTCRPDLNYVSSATTTAFVVSGSGAADAFAGVNLTQRSQAIEIILRDGTRLRRLVTAVAPSAGNSRITVNSAVTLSAATVARISWMPKARFAGDDLVTEWLSPYRATIATAFRTVDQ